MCVQLVRTRAHFNKRDEWKITDDWLSRPFKPFSLVLVLTSSCPIPIHSDSRFTFVNIHYLFTVTLFNMHAQTHRHTYKDKQNANKANESDTKWGRAKFTFNASQCKRGSGYSFDGPCRKNPHLTHCHQNRVKARETIALFEFISYISHRLELPHFYRVI